MHDHEFKVRPWGIACWCGSYVDMGRTGTEAEAEWEAEVRRQGREIINRLAEEKQEDEHSTD